MFGVILALTVLIWWWVPRHQVNEIRQKIEKLDSQTSILENAVAKLDKLDQLNEFTRQKDALNRQVEGLNEKATKVGLVSSLQELQERIKQIEIQFANKEKELIAARKGKIFVATAPENAIIKISNIEQTFQQGMELEPGEYRVQVSSKGYESQQRSIELGLGEKKRIKIELKKIIPKVARLFVETVSEDATVRILNIKPKFVQGIELEPGSYHVEVAAEGYETKRRWVDIAAGHKEPVRFDLAKIEIAEPAAPEKVITNSLGMKFVPISAGSFNMGSQLSPEKFAKRYGGEAKLYKDEQPKHPVKISKPFHLQTTEVSQGQWKKVMGDNPSIFKGC